MRLIERQHGIAMTEVLVSAVIMAIGISGLGILLLQALQGTQDSAQQSQAIWMVQDYAGKIRANGAGARRGGYALSTQPDCAIEPAICADHLDRSGDPADAADCGPDTMATYDTWITMCGLEDGIYDSPADFLVNSQMTSTCTLQHASRSTNETTGANDCIQYTVGITWDIRDNKDASNTDSTKTYSLVVELN